MIKGNSYILVFSVLLFLIILLISATPIILKTLLVIITIGFLSPIARGVLSKDKCRKIKVAFYTSMTFTIGFFLFSIYLSIKEEQSFHLNSELFIILIIVLFYSLLGNFLFGLPVSVIADIISMKFFHFRIWLSGLIHIGFGFGTYFLVSDFLIPAIFCSIIFFALDEITRKLSISH
ncbi:MAG: hypothetical protein ACO1OT_18115 [Heyndrickxia sp.]